MDLGSEKAPLHLNRAEWGINPQARRCSETRPEAETVSNPNRQVITHVSSTISEQAVWKPRLLNKCPMT